MVVLLLLLALGGHTPFFKLLYYTVPGLNKFRGPSKFGFVATVFIAMLAGTGCNELLKGRRPSRGLLGSLCACSAILLCLGLAVQTSGSQGSTTGWWHSVVVTVANTGEIYTPRADYDQI